MELAQITRKSRTATVILCSLLLLLFAAISYSAVLTKNATIDEPTHAMSGWLAIKDGDFRLETVNPSLWKCWAALGNIFVHLNMTPDPVLWKNPTWDPKEEVAWSAKMLYGTPGVDGDAFINRARAMMLIQGVLLGCLVARWSYRIAGPVAAVTATTLFSFDPNFIAHAPLVKSDVTFALVLLALAYAVWQLGKNATAGWIAASCLLCGIAINIKFSGVIAGPILSALLLVRALFPVDWEFLGKLLTTRWQRIGTVIALCFLAAFGAFIVTWACYGFRFRPAPEPAARMDMNAIYARAQLVETTADLLRAPTAAEIAAHSPSLTAQFVRWADQYHLLPEAMLSGLLYQHSCVQLWQGFLNDELYGNGRIAYFPLATLYKTPVSELLAYGGMLLVLLHLSWKRLRRVASSQAAGFSFEPLWTALCLLVPFTIFGSAALSTHLNIGLRNVLPLFPFLQIAAGCAVAFVWPRRRRFTAVVAGLLSIGLVTETLTAWPDYIAFFNFPTNGPIGGIRHLSDSNLDWGQDIKSLAAWRRAHPELPLYAKLFELVDLRYYGLDYHPLLVMKNGPNAGQPYSDIPMQPGWIAVSATQLQGLYINPWERPFYARLRTEPPAFILGGTIYIYQYPLPK